MGGKIKQISSKILTLSYPKYRFFVFLVVLILLFIIPVEILEAMPNLSICSRVLGKYCPSMGIMRGVSSLLKGNFINAVNYNFFSIPVLALMMGFLIHDLFKGFINKKK